MSLLNAALVWLFDLLVLPFRRTPPIVGLTVISLLVGVAILLAFARLSDQDALEDVKRRISGGIYEIRLYKDDLRTIFAAQFATLRHTGTYFRLSLVPMLWVMIPIIVLVIQLQFQYGYEALEPGQPTVLSVELTEEGAARVDASRGADLALETPAGVRAETPAVWIPSKREAAWRVSGDAPGPHELTIRIGDETFTKSLRVAGTTELRSPVRPSGLWGQIIYPAERPLPRGSSVSAIRIDYADADVWLLGWETHWIIVFFILSTVFAFALAKPLGVKI